MIYGTKLKILLKHNGHNLTKVNNELNKLNNTNLSVQNLSNKINRESLKYTEVLQILELIDYKCEWTPNKRIINKTSSSKYNSEISNDFCYFKIPKKNN